MRLGWSVLCKDFEVHDDDMITLKQVFADTILDFASPIPPSAEVEFTPPVVLVSYWFSESDVAHRRYPAVLRVLAPDDNQILEEWSFAFDFLQSASRLLVFRFRELMFVGDGPYEFHVEVPEFGEWVIKSRNSLYISDTL